MTADEREIVLEKLEQIIAHACEICDSTDGRGMPASEVEMWADKLAEKENERHELLAALTTEDREALRAIIVQKMVEQNDIAMGAPLEDARNKARNECARLRMRWERISPYAGLVPIEVNGRDFLDEIARDVPKFVSVDKQIGQIASLWTVHTHLIAYRVVHHSPRLLVWSLEAESGKSTFANFLTQLVRNPLPSGGVTGEGLLAILRDRNNPPPVSAGQWTSIGSPAEVKTPTLLIDEADNIVQTQKFRRIMNKGHEWCGTIQELNRRTREMEVIGTFAPAAIFAIDTAERGSLRSYSPLQTRSIEIQLKRAAVDPEHDADPSDDLFNELNTVLRPKIETWVETHAEEIGQAYRRLKREIKHEQLGRVIRPRARDNWLPLMAIAEVAGGHWPETARELCVKFAPHRVGQGDALEGPEVAIEPTALKPAASLGGRVAVAKFRILSTL